MVDEGAAKSLVEGVEAIEVSSPTDISELTSKMRLKGTVKRLELYGAFVDIGVGTNAILHISKLPNRVNRISDALSIDDEVVVWVLKVDQEKDQVTVTMIEPLAVDWADLKIGQVYSGNVTRLERFGAFVDIGAEKEGLIHISELSHDYIKHPSEAAKTGQELDVQVLGFSKRKRRIDLSRKALLETPQLAVEEVIEEEEEEEEEMPTAMEIALRRAMSAPPVDSVVGDSSNSTYSSGEKDRTEQDNILSRTLKLGEEANE